MGTTGEGILLSSDERRRVTDLFVAACSGRLDVAVHCGAQTTADTVALAEHAASAGADAVAVIGPPYFQLDDAALLAHFAAAAAACAPTPFYVYEFAKVSGYAVPVPVMERLREAAPNLAGMKVSDSPFDEVEPYLLESLDIFIGAEGLIGAGMERGARGSVSALATAFPELVGAAVRDPSAERSAQLSELREGLEAFPRHAALKRILGCAGSRSTKTFAPRFEAWTTRSGGARRLGRRLDRGSGRLSGRARLHPEDAEGRLRDRRVQRRGNPEGDDLAGVDRIDDPVVPEARGRVVRASLAVVLRADLVGIGAPDRREDGGGLLASITEMRAFGHIHSWRGEYARPHIP